MEADVIEVMGLVWKDNEISGMTTWLPMPTYSTQTNSFTRKCPASKRRTDSNYTNYSTKWHQQSKMMFSLYCVNVCGCFCFSLNLPDTFVEDVEFVICQTFFLEDCDDSVVDAATQQTHKLVYIIVQNAFEPLQLFLHLDCIWHTCSRWRWLLPSSASLLCPLVNFSRFSPAHWGWGSSSTSAGAESSWGTYRGSGKKQEYALSSGQERKKVRL